MLKHNKKRNTGILYQALVSVIAESLINGTDDKIKLAKGIILKHFVPGTCLSTELKLFNSVVDRKNYCFENQTDAKLFFDKVKQVASTVNQEKLDLEKTALIHEINKTLGQDVFSKEIKDYKILATIQTVFNSSRILTENSNSFDKIFELEQLIYEHLVFKTKHQYQEQSVSVEEILNSDIQTLTLKIFENKIEQKFKDSFNPEQKRIIRLYLNGETDTLVSELNGIKDRVLTRSLNESQAVHQQVVKEDKVLEDKLGTIRTVLEQTKLGSDKRDIGLILNVLSLEAELLKEGGSL